METLQEGGFSNLADRLKAFFFPKTGGNVSGSVTASGKVKAATIEDSDGTLASLRESVSDGSALPVMSPSGKGGAKLGSGLSVEDDALNLGPLTASGSGASVETDGSGIFGVTGEGWSEQRTTTGKNLLDTSKVISKQGNGTITGNLANGFTIDSGASGITTARIASLPYEVGQTYTLSFDAVASDSFILYVDFGDQNQAGTAIGNPYISVSAGARRYSYTGVYGEATSYKHLDIGIGAANSSITITNIMLEAGSTPTDYEPYTGGAPSPSPDYPQEIRVARGRNLLPHAAASSIVHNGITFESDGKGSYRYHGTTGSSSAYVDIPFPTESYAIEAGSYMHLRNTATSVNVVLDLRDSNGNGIVDIGLSPLNRIFPLSGKEGAVVSKLRLYVSPNQSNVDITITPSIENNPNPTPYVPYGHVGLEVRGRNLLTAVSATNTGGGVTKSYDRETGVFSASGTVTTSQTDISLTLIEPIHVPTGEVLTFGMIDGVLEVNGTFFVFVHEKEASYPEYHGIRTQDRFCNFTNIGGKVIDQILIRMTISTGTVNINTHPTLELGSAVHDYEPYRHTTTPIPLPAKGFAGALPDGTKDTLSVDSAGRYEWMSETDEAVFDGSSDEHWSLQANNSRAAVRPSPRARKNHAYKTVAPIFSDRFVAKSVYEVSLGNAGVTINNLTFDEGDSPLMFNNGSQTMVLVDWISFLQANPVTVLYPLANPTTEHGYIDLPELPAGATVSIPELEAIGVEWWVNGAEAIAEHGRDVSKANKEQEDRIAELEAAVANLATS